MKHLLFISLCLIYLSSCTTADVTPLITDLQDGQPASCSLDLYESKEALPNEAKSLCRIQVKVPLYPWNDHTLTEALKITQQLACQHGANSLYISDIKGNLLIAVATQTPASSRETARDLDWMNAWLVCQEYQWEWDGSSCKPPAQPALSTDRTRLRGMGTPQD